jgi:shikimate kinase
MRAENRQLLQQRGIVVYLNAPVEVQMARTAKDKSRPLLQKANPKKILQNLYQIRDPLYRQVAHIILPTGHTYPRNMVNQLLQQLEIFLSSTDNELVNNNIEAETIEDNDSQ